jgi:FKBP-type peptidyl-prolyl cis-trans isomerase
MNPNRFTQLLLAVTTATLTVSTAQEAKPAPPVTIRPSAPGVQPAPGGRPTPMARPAGVPGGPGGAGPGLQPPAPAPDPADATAFKTPEERRNYALGVFMGNQLKRMDDGSSKTDLAEVEAGFKSVMAGEKSADFVNGAQLANMLKKDDLKVDIAQLMVALKETLNGDKPKLSEGGMRAEMQLVQQDVTNRRQEKARQEGELNQKEAAAILEKNAKEEGVTTTPTGLQFKVVKKAEGVKPKADEMVTVNYVASLANGKEFERSPEGTPRTVPQSMTKGWQEAMAMMEIGSKYKFWMPPALAYGEAGRPPQVRPNSLVVYEVELVGTQAAPAPTAALGMATPPISIPGAVPPPANRQPISATTPPVSIDIPAKPAPEKGKDAPQETKPAEEKK